MLYTFPINLVTNYLISHNPQLLFIVLFIVTGGNETGDVDGNDNDSIVDEDKTDDEENHRGGSGDDENVNGDVNDDDDDKEGDVSDDDDEANHL